MDIAAFYDALAPSYDLFYEDWEAAIERQGEQLDAVLRRALGHGPPGTVLDAACGIGTQALGLAELGWRVAGSDVSEAALERARREAAARGLDLELSRADLRHVHDHHGRTFDAVLACDNSLPHLLTDDELRCALVQMRRATAPGGVALVSMRDYRALVAAGELDEPSLRPYGTRLRGRHRYSVFQEWVPRPQEDGRLLYDVTVHLLADRPESANPADPGVKTVPAEPVTGRYYAVAPDRVLELMAEAGFSNPERRDGDYFQPLLVGRAGS